MNKLKVLVIDDEKLIRWSFDKKLTPRGYEVLTAESGEEGIELYEQHFPDVVFVDNKLPGIQGLEVVTKIKTINKDAVVVFITAYGTIENAVEAIKLGAHEFINKPFTFDEIFLTLDSIVKKLKTDKEIQILKRIKKEDFTFSSIVCESKEMKEIISLAKRIAKTETTNVLLLGESGTGKDVFAQAIHNESNRCEQPFVTINCSSLPETLLESELFGYEKGAFTDAKTQKKGLFEIAEGGTVFLDEIGEINHATQVKLLGVLENRKVRRLGGTKDISVEIRIIAATNRELKEAVSLKLFREDLYYRLKVFQIRILPLRDRKDDVLPLSNYFIDWFNAQFRKKINGISDETQALLLQYDWPGNVRELRNVIERAVILENNEVLYPENLPLEIRKTNTISEPHLSDNLLEIPDEGISLEGIEKELIRQALEKANHNQTRAAELLRISRDTLRYKKKKHGL